MPELIARLSHVGFEDLAMTTNGTELSRLATSLAAAGLQRVNISCDSLRADRFGAIRKRGNLTEVLGAMDAAEAAGLSPLKVNVVLLRGQNDDEILDFASFARETGRMSYGSSSSCRWTPKAAGTGVSSSRGERSSSRRASRRSGRSSRGRTQAGPHRLSDFASPTARERSG